MLLLEQEVGLRDKVLAEFVINLAKSSQTVADFENSLVDNGADFTIDLINNLYAMITRVIPDLRKLQKPVETAETRQENGIAAHYHSTGVYQNLDDVAEETKSEAKPVKEELAKNFPGLSIPNKTNKEEIELDFDFEAIIETKLEESKERQRRKSSESDGHKRRRKDSRERRRDSRERRHSRSRSRERGKRRHHRRSGSSSSSSRDSRHRRRQRSSSDDSRRGRSRRNDSRERDRHHREHHRTEKKPEFQLG